MADFARRMKRVGVCIALAAILMATACKRDRAGEATRLNAELSENNESYMFVTMFIGLVNLTTGHLHFCN